MQTYIVGLGRMGGGKVIGESDTWRSATITRLIRRHQGLDSDGFRKYDFSERRIITIVLLGQARKVGV